MAPLPANRRAIGEITAVVATGAVYLLFENVFHLKLPFLALCIAGWGLYAGWRLRRDPQTRRDWGFRTDTLAPSAFACAIFYVIVSAAILAWRVWKGWIPILPSTALLFVVYPVWGLCQQFLVQALIAGNLERLGAPRLAIVPVAAILFGLAHWPDVPLMALCAGAGLVWTSIFLRFPNLLAISLTHAWLGSLAYLMILERNPWAEMKLPV